MVRTVDVTGLVHERERASAQALRPLLGDADTTSVRGDHGDIVKVALEAVTDVIDKNRHGDQMVDRAVEEALGLRGVQVDAHHSVGSGGAQQIEDETAGNGLAAEVLLVLTGVAQKRADGGDGTGRCALQCVDHDELFHDGLVDIAGVALQYKDIRATHRFGVAHIHLTVREIVCCSLQNVDAKLVGDVRRQLGMLPAGDKNEILTGLSF